MKIWVSLSLRHPHLLHRPDCLSSSCRIWKEPCFLRFHKCLFWLQNYGFMHFSQTGTYQSNGLDIYAAQKFVISAKELDNVDKNVGAFVLKYIRHSSHHHPLGWLKQKLVRFRESLLNTKAQGHYFTMVNIGFQVVQTRSGLDDKCTSSRSED